MVFDGQDGSSGIFQPRGDCVSSQRPAGHRPSRSEQLLQVHDLPVAPTGGRLSLEEFSLVEDVEYEGETVESGGDRPAGAQTVGASQSAPQRHTHPFSEEGGIESYVVTLQDLSAAGRARTAAGRVSGDGQPRAENSAGHQSRAPTSHASGGRPPRCTPPRCVQFHQHHPTTSPSNMRELDRRPPRRSPHRDGHAVGQSRCRCKIGRAWWTRPKRRFLNGNESGNDLNIENSPPNLPPVMADGYGESSRCWATCSQTPPGILGPEGSPIKHER